MGFEVLLSRESWPSLAGYFIIVSLTGMDKAVFLLDPILPMAVSGRFLLGLPCAVFVQDLHGSSVISRQEGPVLFPCDGTKDWLPCGRKGDIEQSTGTLIRLPSWHSDHSSAWLSTGTDQQFRVTCKRVPVEIWVETNCSALLKNIRDISPCFWLSLWGLNSANQYGSQFYTESFSFWESRTLKSAAPKRLHWGQFLRDYYFFFFPLGKFLHSSPWWLSSGKENVSVTVAALKY